MFKRNRIIYTLINILICTQICFYYCGNIKYEVSKAIPVTGQGRIGV
jgi:hypothetical protein